MTLQESVEYIGSITMAKDSDASAVQVALEEFGLDEEAVRDMLKTEISDFIENDPRVLDLSTPHLLAGSGVHFFLIGLHYGRELK